MKGLLLVARRDLAAYVNSYWGFAIIACALVLDGLLFNGFALTEKSRYSSEIIEDFFKYSFGVTVAASILLTMRLLAEERQTGTIVLVDSSPLADWQVVGGKYLSAMVVLSTLILLTVYMPALVFINGKVSYGHLFAGYLGLFLVAGTVASVGTFTSTISSSQLVAGFLSTVLSVGLLLMWLIARVADPPLKDLISYSSLFDRHFTGFMRGQINSEDVVYYLSICFFFLMGSTRFLAMRRWR
jgi:ABC-2 type transport system permease protein